MIWNGLDRYRDAGMLVLRLGLGLGFLFYHGWGKLIGGPERWEGVGSAMSVFGIDSGHMVFGFLAAFAESIGGLMIAAGLFFRPICAMVAFTMFVATTRHIVTGQGSPAHSFKYLFILLGLILVGPGRFSLDAWLSERRSHAPSATHA